MDLSALKVDDDWWLTIFRWLSILAILISLVAAVCVHLFTARVTRVMKAEISKANVTAAEAGRRTEELRGENLKLAIVLEEEKRARLDIQGRMADRFLSEQEKTAISEAARPFPGQAITILAIGPEPEPELYARQIIAVLEEAKWKVERAYGTMLGSAEYGLAITTGSHPSKSVQSFLAGLRKAKLGFSTRVGATLPADGITMTVGPKDKTS